MRKRNLKRNIVFAAAVVLIVAAAACFFRISTKDEFYGGESPLWESGPGATLSIECKTAAENLSLLPEELRSERYVPRDGYILPPTKLALEKDETAYSLFLRAAKYYEIPFEAQAAGDNSLGTAYIQSINQLSEFDGGELSGWMYSVNGEFPSAGCDSFTVSDGDVVRFVYSFDLGKDVGGGFEE